MKQLNDGRCVENAPYLQAMAIRILTLLCSSRCECNWSTFETVSGCKHVMVYVRKNNKF